MIFYFEVTVDYLLETGQEQEKGLVMAPNYAEAVKQMEQNMYDCLISIDKLEAIDSTSILYLTRNPLREPLIQMIKEEAVW